MKYLKRFENNDHIFNLNDIVVLIDNDSENAPLMAYFKVGDLYKISYIDESDELPYRIGYLNENETEELIHAAWVMESQLRLAESHEITSNKYNL